jgi:cell division protease FtsH
MMASLPEEDRHGYTKQWLESRLAITFGGRVAEELVFGPDKITTGAGDDIQQATDLARRMVTQFGMSDRVGVMAVGDKEQEIFLGREFAQRREVSERTAELVDDEVKRLLDEAFQRAHTLISENRALLDRVAEALLERETLDREDLDLLREGKPLPPVPIPSPSTPALTGEDSKESEAKSPPILGTPPPEPAGA